MVPRKSFKNQKDYYFRWEQQFECPKMKVFFQFRTVMNPYNKDVIHLYRAVRVCGSIYGASFLSFSRTKEKATQQQIFSITFNCLETKYSLVRSRNYATNEDYPRQETFFLPPSPLESHVFVIWLRVDSIYVEYFLFSMAQDMTGNYVNGYVSQVILKVSTNILLPTGYHLLR